MARDLTRFEADPSFFAAGAITPEPMVNVTLIDHENDVDPARLLRWQRLEGLDDEAVLPEPILPLPQVQAFDVAPLSEEPETPDAEEFAEVLSEAVDVPADWASFARMAGGGAVANCIREMLAALNWIGDPRQIAEVLPVGPSGLDQSNLESVFFDLGFDSQVVEVRLRDLGPADLPALFIAMDGNAFVLGTHQTGSISGYDGKSNLLRPILADGTSGNLYRFTRIESPSENSPQLYAGSTFSKPFRHLWAATRGRRWALSSFTGMLGMMGSLGALLLMIAIDHALPANSLPLILFYAGSFALFMAFEIVTRLLRDRVLISTTLGQDAETLRQRLLQVLGLQPDALRKTTAGDRRARMLDMDGEDRATVGQLAIASSDFLSALIFLAIIAGVAGWLAIGPAAVIVNILLVMALMSDGAAEKISFAVRAVGRLRARWNDDGTVLAAAGDAACVSVLNSRMDKETVSASQHVGQARNNLSILNATVAVLAGIGLVATGLFGFHLVVGGHLSAGQLTAGLFLSWLALAATIRVASQTGVAQHLMIVEQQAEKLDSLAKDFGNHQSAGGPRKLAGHVDVSHLSTHAGNGVELPLDNVSFHAEPGDVVVIVGDYQSGKSGLLQVLAGMMPISGGQARLDGLNIEQFDPVALRQSVSYVPEMPEFLPLTLAENLLLADPLASEADLQAACARAGVMEDIRVLEIGAGANRSFGFEVPMGLLATEPVPGFFKKVALARGYLRNSSVLMLDGPERHLDPDGEQALMLAIEEIRNSATVIIATDRPSLIRLADSVVWLDGGQVRSTGTSTDVLELLYAEHQVGQTLAAS